MSNYFNTRFEAEAWSMQVNAEGTYTYTATPYPADNTSAAPCIAVLTIASGSIDFAPIDWLLGLVNGAPAYTVPSAGTPSITTTALANISCRQGTCSQSCHLVEPEDADTPTKYYCACTPADGA